MIFDVHFEAGAWWAEAELPNEEGAAYASDVTLDELKRRVIDLCSVEGWPYPAFNTPGIN